MASASYRLRSESKDKLSRRPVPHFIMVSSDYLSVCHVFHTTRGDGKSQRREQVILSRNGAYVAYYTIAQRRRIDFNREIDLCAQSA